MTDFVDSLPLEARLCKSSLSKADFVDQLNSDSAKLDSRHADTSKFSISTLASDSIRFSSSVVSSLMFWVHSQVLTLLKNGQLQTTAQNCACLRTILQNGHCSFLAEPEFHRTKVDSFQSDHDESLFLHSLDFSDKEEFPAKDSTIDKKKKTRKVKRQQPNYFVSVPVNNEEIRQNLNAVQDRLIKKAPKLKNALIPLSAMHITLLVTYLDEEHCLHHVKEALDSVVTRFRKSTDEKKLNLEFEGIGNFKHQVLFATMKKNKQMEQIAESVRESFAAAELANCDERPFAAHLTLAKLSRLDFRTAKKLRKIQPQWYEQDVAAYFGTESVTELHVCSMLKRSENDDHYYTPLKVKLFE